MSEFREDPVSGDWVILAPERAKRPEEFLKAKSARVFSSKQKCPFEDLEKSGNWPPIATYPRGSERKRWRIAVIPNKYPALTHSAGHAVALSRGMYAAKTGVGSHEIVLARDHRKSLADLDAEAAEELLSVFAAPAPGARPGPLQRLRLLLFLTGGPKRAHRFPTRITRSSRLPIVPPHTTRSLRGAEQYYKKHRRCVRCDIIATERKEQRRVIAENRGRSPLRPMPESVPLK